MPEENKGRITLWFTPEGRRNLDAAMVAAGSKSLSEFAEKAVNFYSGWLSALHHTDYFTEAVSQTVAGLIATTENRLARLQFKEAVELAKLAHMMAASSDIDEDTLRRLHVRCVEEVKRINGVVRLEDAVKFQKGN